MKLNESEIYNFKIVRNLEEKRVILSEIELSISYIFLNFDDEIKFFNFFFLIKIFQEKNMEFQ